ncbi:MAG: cyclase family protein [Spirochaetales bacterium]|nr:cyclase family protein [Spirochaetales bacterium]
MLTKKSGTIIDLTHPITENMPVYPGTEPPLIEEACTLEEHRFREKRLTLFSHTGTHMDAPYHLLEKGPTLDDFPLDHFTGRAFMLDASEEGGLIEVDRIRTSAGEIGKADFLLIRTGWSAYWGRADYFGRFPVLSEEAARALVELDLKGIGLDCISADPMGSTRLPNHKILLGAGMVIVENLCRLEELPREGCHFSAFPLKIERADGSPVRAFARVGEGAFPG